MGSVCNFANETNNNTTDNIDESNAINESKKTPLQQRNAGANKEEVTSKISNIAAIEPAENKQLHHTYKTKIDIHTDIHTKQNLIMYGYCRCIQAELQKSQNNITMFIPEEIILLCMKYLKLVSIMNIAVGSCGIKLNNAFYKSIYNEYNLNDNGTQMNNNNCINNIYLSHTTQSTYVPRSILIDIPDSNEDKNYILNSVNGIYANNNYNIICGNWIENVHSNNWAKGYYTEGAKLIDQCMGAFRKDIETYDNPLGVQFMHSVGGGIGGGLGALMMSRIKDKNPKLVMTSFAVFPSVKVADIVVQPSYNTTLSIAKLSEFCDAVFVIDNTALWNIAKYKYKIQLPDLLDLNFIANQGISDVTSLFRCNDSYGFDLRSFVETMVQYPELKYLTISKAPFYSVNEKQHKTEIVESDIINNCDKMDRYEYGMKLTQKLFRPKHRSFSDCNIVDNGFNLSTVILHRGFHHIAYNKKTVADISNKLATSVKKKIFRYKSNNIISTSIKQSPLYIPESVAMISNNTAIKLLLIVTSAKYARLYQRKAFLHYYKGEGMDEWEFQESDMFVRDLITLYREQENNLIEQYEQYDDQASESESEQTEYEYTMDTNRHSVSDGPFCD